MPVEFLLREEVLEPVAVVGVGATAIALAERLLRCSDDELRALRGCAAPGLVAVLGPSSLLPWVDGVAYLGRDPRAPSLLLPTTLYPSVGGEIFEVAIRRRAPELVPPILVLASPRRFFSAVDALPIVRGRLRGWWEAQA